MVCSPQLCTKTSPCPNTGSSPADLAHNNDVK